MNACVVLKRCSLLLLGAAMACSPAGELNPADDQGVQATTLIVVPASGMDSATYAALHHRALEVGQAGWAEAMDALAIHGDGFSLSHLSQLEPSSLRPENAEQLQRTVASIEERMAAPHAAQFKDQVLPMLERAAWTDLVCDRLESSLPAWSRASVVAHLQDPGVRSEVQRIQAEYVGSGPDLVGSGDFPIRQKAGVLTKRVRRYAGQILSSE